MAEEKQQQQQQQQHGVHGQLFTGGDSYSLFRPTYPHSLYQFIFSKLELFSQEKKRAVDLGCGTGQTTEVLSKYFDHVIGVDPSESQLKSAFSAPNIEYVVGAAENLHFLEGESVDLLTVAQAVHWIEQEKLWKEAERVLKRGGGVAVWGYAMPKITSSPIASQSIDDYHNSLWAGGYWEQNRKLVDDHYNHLKLPFSNNFSTEEFKIEKELSIEKLISYLRTASAHKTYRTRNPDSPDPLLSLEAKLMSDLNAPDNQFLVPISHPLFLFLSIK